jgi:hypothetical protein
VVLHRYRISNPYVLKNIDNPKFTQTAKSNLENKDSKTGVLNLQGCKGNVGSQVHAHNDKHSCLKNYSNSLPILEWLVTE